MPFEDLPNDVYFERTTAKFYRLFVNGNRVNITGFACDKWAFRNYFKNKYGVDLRTDPRIKKNYKEFTTKKINANTYIKTELNALRLQ